MIALRFVAGNPVGIPTRIKKENLIAELKRYVGEAVMPHHIYANYYVFASEKALEPNMTVITDTWSRLFKGTLLFFKWDGNDIVGLSEEEVKLFQSRVALTHNGNPASMLFEKKTIHLDVYRKSRHVSVKERSETDVEHFDCRNNDHRTA